VIVKDRNGSSPDSPEEKQDRGEEWVILLDIVDETPSIEMGTIASLDPGKEKKLVTYDEIIAHEEKATAIVIKDSAIKLASKEHKRPD